MKEYFITVTKVALLSLITLVVLALSATTVNASGTLAVTGVNSIKLTGIANNTYADGWKWVFHITLPSNENLVRMRFSDFTNGSQVIPANNIRLYSSQSVNSNSEATAIQISAADTYSDQPVLSGVEMMISNRSDKAGVFVDCSFNPLLMVSIKEVLLALVGDVLVQDVKC